MRFAHDVDAGETSRFAGSSAQQLVAPSIQQSRALHHDRLLLLQRPTPPALTAGDNFDPLRASTHTTTRMSARSASVPVVLITAQSVSTIMLQETSSSGAAKQCGGSATLTTDIPLRPVVMKAKRSVE
jgi:hypothetical protein